MHNTVRGTSIAVPDTVRGNESDYLDTSKFTRATEEKNPCWEESKISMRCLENNGYDKTKCGAAFDNYNVCKKFWNEVIKEKISMSKI